MEATLVKALEGEVARLSRWMMADARARRLWDGTIDRASYALYLAQTYQYVRWTAPLLASGARRLRRLGRYPALAELFAVKAREEAGHEKWALADLRALGEDFGELWARAPSPAVTAYVAWNSFLVTAGSPVGFLGTAYVLESLSVRHGGEAVANLCARGAIPGISRAITFLRGHAGADVGHLEALAALLGQVDDERDRRAILLSARVTAALFEGLLEGASEDAARAAA